MYAGSCFDEFTPSYLQLNYEVVSRLEKSFTTEEVVSLTFLLFDEPFGDTLERLKLLECNAMNANVISDWVADNHTQNHWKNKFLEACCICQLNDVIQEIGFEVRVLKIYFMYDTPTASKYLNPAKKLLFKICEHITSDLLKAIRYRCNLNGVLVHPTNYFEIVIVEMLKQKFIFIPSNSILCCNLVPLKNVLEDVGQTQFHESINKLQKSFDLKLESIEENDESCYSSRNRCLPKLKRDEIGCKEYYPIKDKKNVGLCIIVNQVLFCPSDVNLEERHGSDKDEVALIKLFHDMGFRVKVLRNMKSTEVEKISLKIEDDFRHAHSVFALCILSHGTKGCVYGSDSKPITVEKIQSLLYKENLRGIPKILLIAACQHTESPKSTKIVLDGPTSFKSSMSPFPPMESDMLIFRASYGSAIRVETLGTLFIQTFCDMMVRHSGKDVLYICTKINDSVCSLSNTPPFDNMCQTSNFESSLTKILKLGLVKQ